MTIDEASIKQVQAALETEPRVNVHRCPIHLGLMDDTLTLDGDVDSIIARKVALRVAGSVPGVTRVTDCLRVLPVQSRSDGEILEALSQALLRECDLRNCSLRRIDRGRMEVLHEAVGDDACGDVRFSVAAGVVTLEGHVISLTHRRMIEVLAWWAPGCRQVDNRLAVVPGEEDNDDEINDAVKLVLELDSLVHADQIVVNTTLATVTLDGVVARPEESRRAELDAWYVSGVSEVLNRLEVRPA